MDFSLLNKILSGNFDLTDCSKEELDAVTELRACNGTLQRDEVYWDFSPFPNLKKLDFDGSHITELNLTNNSKLEEIEWTALNQLKTIDLSGNPELRSYNAAQDHIKCLDFSNNPKLEKLSVFLSSSLKWLNLDNCHNLKHIFLKGTLIPIIDITSCHQLESLNAHYWNTYQNKYDYYGPGFPRPIIFAPSDFNEDIIPGDIRRISYYTYYLVRTAPDSKEYKYLQQLKENKERFLNIRDDNFHGLGRIFYEIKDELDSL